MGLDMIDYEELEEKKTTLQTIGKTKVVVGSQPFP